MLYYDMLFDKKEKKMHRLDIDLPACTRQKFVDIAFRKFQNDTQ